MGSISVSFSRVRYLPLTMGPIGCPHTSVHNYQQTLVTSQNSDGFIYTVAEARNQAQYRLVVTMRRQCVCCEVWTGFLNLTEINFTLQRAVPWARRLVAGLSPRRPREDHSSVHVRFAVERVAMGQVSLPVLRFSSVSIILPVPHTHLHPLYVAPARRTNGPVLGTFQNSPIFRKSGRKGSKSTSYCTFNLEGWHWVPSNVLRFLEL
jgi:hypothetical protein